MPRKVYFNVAPRYTAGSPALVDARTARDVAANEVVLVPRIGEGFYGDEKRLEYMDRGLRGIVYMTWEANGFVWVQDVITQELFRVSLKQWGKGNWINWHDKTNKEMGTFLYTKDDRASLMQPLPF